MQCRAIKGACRDPEDDPLGIVNGGVERIAIQKEKNLHSGVSHPFVAVYEGMILNQPEAQRGRLLQKGLIEIRAVEGLLRLAHRRLEGAEISKSGRAPALVKQAGMQREDLGKGEIPNGPRDHEVLGG